MDLKAWIREIPDFPKPGILFKDITPLLKEPEAFSYAVDRMATIASERALTWSPASRRAGSSSPPP